MLSVGGTAEERVVSALAALQAGPLFRSLTANEHAQLARLLRHSSHGRGQMIFRYGDPGTCLYVISSGVVKIVRTSADGRELIFAMLGAGDIFGELALLDGEPRSADAIVQEPTELHLLDRDPFLLFLKEHPQVAARLLATLSRRIRHTDDTLEDAAFLEIRTRLARTILSLMSTMGETGKRSGIRLSQRDLAALIGTTRESVNRWLRHYQERGVLRLERGAIHVMDKVALESER